MTDDDEAAFWQSVLEREQQEQEAADALHSYQSLSGSQATAAPAKESKHGIQESGEKEGEASFGADWPEWIR
jgi:hypothetical protein